MINQAIEFATIKHANQMRKGTEIPYILHCLEAGIIAANLTTTKETIDNDVVSATILHDTIEDADVSYEELARTFNKTIADLVSSQSEDKSKAWIERKTDTIRLLKENESRAIEIATLADKLSNMRSISKDYDVQKESIWDKFNAGKESQYWYYNAIAESLTQVQATNEYKEFKDLIQKTFET